MEILEMLEITEIYLKLRDNMIELTDDILKYHLLVKGSQPHSYEEGEDNLYNGMKELVSSEGKRLFSIEHGIENMTLDYLNSKLSEVIRARLELCKVIDSKVLMDTYVFIDSKGMSIYTVQR